MRAALGRADMRPDSDPETWSDTEFRAMGTRVRVLVRGGPDDLPRRARARVDDLEARWSRFRPTSELSRLNATPDWPVVVSPETFALVHHAVDAWRATGGCFDPTVHDAMLRAGYDADFATVAARSEPRRDDAPRPAEPDTPGRPAPGCGGIRLDPLVRSVTLPAGVRLDLGGIGKGAAADHVVTELMDAGAAGACVDLGGDVRVAGEPPEADAWSVVLDPALAPGWVLRIRAGAVATSSRTRRAWRRHGREVHHLLDPRTGEPATTGLRAVTVLAATAAWAEIIAKAAFVAGPEAGAELVAGASLTGLLVHDDGHVSTLAGLAGMVA